MQGFDLTPEEEAKLLASLTRENPRRKAMAEIMAMDENQMRNEDLAPVREGLRKGLKGLDSVTGAPTRQAISQILATKSTDPAGPPIQKVIDQFGADPDTAPSWEDIAGQAGIENETVKKGIGLLGPLLEPNIPFGAAAGMAKKVGRGADVVDFQKALEAQGGPRPVDKIAKMHGDLGKVIGVSEDKLPIEAKAKYGIERIQDMSDNDLVAHRAMLRDDQSIGKHSKADIEKEYLRRQESGSLKPKIYTQPRDEWLDRFANHGWDKKITRAFDRIQEKGKNPYASIVESGLKNQPVPIPKFNFEAGNEIGTRKIAHTVANKTDVMDPLPWVDTKYEITKNALKNAKGPVRINTSSDLIARQDYIEALPPGSTVHIYALSPNDSLNRILFPGNPSQGRLERAVEKLKESGVKVKMVMPTADEYIERALAYDVTNKAMEFGGLGKANGADRIERQTGLTRDELRKQLIESGLRETRLKAADPLEGLDPFGQKAKSKRVRPKQNRGPDDES